VAVRFPQVRKLATPAALRARLDELAVGFPVDDEVVPAPDGPLTQPVQVGRARIGNRWCTLPMEGWDGTTDGRPTELVTRRWERFGAGGAKLIWAEATAVRPDGRANPNQLMITSGTVGELARLRERLVAAHHQAHGRDDDLLVGLQLTHSGRWARPEGTPAPRTAYEHPVLDARVGAGPDAVLTDWELDGLLERFVAAAALAAEAGFGFVDVKACHGYLVHELLSARDRDGAYGGDLDGRSRFLRRAVEGVRSAAPDLEVAVRLSAFDLVPHERGPEGVGVPSAEGPYRYAFGGDGTGAGVDLDEPHRLLEQLVAAGVSLVSITGGSPYTIPHAQRPAYFPPSDGYQPPNDPLIDVARMLGVCAEVTRRHPALVVVASGLTYAQDLIGHVAQGLVREGWCDVVGYGRMALSYPELPTDVLAGRPLRRKAVCRTFSDCTTAPRNGLVSGCFPLDPFYKQHPDRVELVRVKRAAGVEEST
jgi:NADPH2 dehydrogenase